MIEDRNAHINGSRLEQQNEINQIANFLIRESKSLFGTAPTDQGKDIKKPAPRTEMLTFSMAAL